jgi:glycosyltransferase involved in cell wall biosynthesis
MNEVNNRYKRNLDSIFQQDYDNFNVYYVDDFSQDRTGELVEKYLKDNKL